jgi:hypothetical protein
VFFLLASYFFVSSRRAISSGAQHVTQQKDFFTSKFSSLLLCNTAYIKPQKQKLGQYSAEGLLIANHLDQLLWWANERHSETLTRSQIIFIYYTLCAGAHIIAAPILPVSHRKLRDYAESNRHVFTFLHPILVCRIT